MIPNLGNELPLFLWSTAFLVLSLLASRTIKVQPKKGGPFFVSLQDEPEGWQTLQAMAQQEPDPVKLAAIIDQMNSVLSFHEKRTSGKGPEC